MAKVKGGGEWSAKLQKLIGQFSDEQVVKVGFLEGATYPTGEPVAMIAAIHNFGAPRAGIPPRPFFTLAISKHHTEWPNAAQAALKHTNDVDKSLSAVGAYIKGNIQQEINDLWQPPLKPTTVAQKGFDKPLIDTSHMINSVDYRVDKKS